MPTKKPRYTITVDEKLLREIDNYRFEHRIVTKTQATLELVRIGLETVAKQAKKGKKR